MVVIAVLWKVKVQPRTKTYGKSERLYGGWGRGGAGGGGVW